MLNKNMNSFDIRMIGAVLLPLLSLVFVKLTSPSTNLALKSSSNNDSQLLLPTAVQGTGYYISHPYSHRR